MTAVVAAAGAAMAPARTRTRLLGRFWRNRRVLVGLALIFFIAGSALAAGLLSPYDPMEVNPRLRLVPPLGTSRVGTFHVMGTDQSGRDVLSRVLYGGRVSLGVSASAVLLASAAGVVLGLLSGYFGGRLDVLVMRIADVQLAIPTILLAIAIAAALGPSLTNLVIVLAVTNWVIFARSVRASTLTLRELTYVEAARSIGAGDARILTRHVLQNAWTPIIVVFTQQMALMIVLESSLSFIGVGAPVGTPSWGTMVAEGRDYMMTNAWWLTAFPGLAISLTVIGINFFGDGLRDVLDPRLRL
ncbi:MAG: ABC transporter permease [Chloroflexi bacterium]|nr:ABC transporter permease [Chloroflexota bacterium]